MPRLIHTVGSVDVSDDVKERFRAFLELGNDIEEEFRITNNKTYRTVYKQGQVFWQAVGTFDIDDKRESFLGTSNVSIELTSCKISNTARHPFYVIRGPSHCQYPCLLVEKDLHYMYIHPFYVPCLC